MSDDGERQKAELLMQRHSVTVGERRQLGMDEFLALVAEEERQEEEEFGEYPVRVIAIIPGDFGPVTRMERFENPLEDALVGIGVVLGGSTAHEMAPTGR